jgi:ABC-type transport system involved in multi-copper enzyme maturation permease subunit
MKHVRTVALLTFQDAVHRKVLYVFFAIILVLTVLMTLSFVLMSKFSGIGDDKMLHAVRIQSIGSAYAVLWSMGSLGLVILSFISLSSEITQKTAVMLISKSVTRIELYLGKFLGIFIVGVAYSLLASALVFLVGYLIEGSVNRMLWLSNLEGFLTLTIGISSAFLFAAALGLVPAIVLWLVLYILKSAVDILAQGSVPVASALASVLRYIYPASQLFNSIQTLINQAPVSPPGIWDGYLPILHAVDYSALLLVIGAWFFSRRNLMSR